MLLRGINDNPTNGVFLPNAMHLFVQVRASVSSGQQKRDEASIISGSGRVLLHYSCV